jgi:dTDP-glucose 4,6-dehydratase
VNNSLLVTGGAGFIGSNFIRFVQNHAPEVNIVNLDLLTYAGSLENLLDLPHPENYTFIEGDICDRTLVELILREHEIDTIIHFAAESHVDRSLEGPGAFIQTNIMGTYTLLDAARKIWLNENGWDETQVRLHHVSTDEVYGSLTADESAFEETTPYAPNSPYAASKASSDHLVRAYGESFGLPYTISNCSNNYGPHQFPEKLIPLMILNAISGKALPVYGDGKQIRDWLYVEDHCEAIWTILQTGKVGESYNIGGGNQLTNLAIVETICALLDELESNESYQPHAALIDFVKDRPGHDRRYAMNFTKIETELGWRPTHNLQEGMRTTVLWYLENIEWLRAIVEEKGFQNWVNLNYQERGQA